jgi:hypothetical protein
LLICRQKSRAAAAVDSAYIAIERHGALFRAREYSDRRQRASQDADWRQPPTKFSTA